MLLQIETAPVFAPLLAPSRYKGVHGGRGSAKSHFFAELLIERCIIQKTDWACLREVQKTLDQSVKKLLESKIQKFGVGHLFDVQQNRIKTPFGGIIIFQGMQDHTSESIKSLEGFDGAWFEEAQTMSAKSLELLRPTIRKPDSELWFSWNPQNPLDPIDLFLRGNSIPPDSIVVEANYLDNPWFPDVLEKERLFDLSVSESRHAHIWMGAYDESGDGAVIPYSWAMSAIDAHKKLGIPITGARIGALDVADEGKDFNAFCVSHGILIESVVEWSGKGGDIFDTVQRAFNICDERGLTEFRYDGDGLGAGVRGDARIINEHRPRSELKVEPFRGSESPADPDAEDVPGRKNKDYFANRKAQAWWALRMRFQATHRAIIEGVPCDADDLISISSSCPWHMQLINELTRPTYSVNGVGKLLIDKSPDGTKSPNRADAVMIRFAPTERAKWAF